MTVRETLDFAGRFLGVGTRYDLLAELSRREKEGGIKPDPEIDAFMKATAVSGQESSVVTDYALKEKCWLGLLKFSSWMKSQRPAPETFELFDDIILLSEGQIVYQGPREDILSF